MPVLQEREREREREPRPHAGRTATSTTFVSTISSSGLFSAFAGSAGTSGTGLSSAECHLAKNAMVFRCLQSLFALVCVVFPKMAPRADQRNWLSCCVSPTRCGKPFKPSRNVKIHAAWLRWSSGADIHRECKPEIQSWSIPKVADSLRTPTPVETNNSALLRALYRQSTSFRNCKVV